MKCKVVGARMCVTLAQATSSTEVSYPCFRGSLMSHEGGPIRQFPFSCGAQHEGRCPRATRASKHVADVDCLGGTEPSWVRALAG